MTDTPTTPATPGASLSPRGPWSLWAGVLGSPALWLIQFQTNYALVPWVCATRRTWVLHLVTVGFMLAAAGCFVLSWRDWRHIGRIWPTGSVEAPIGRSGLLAVVGMMTSTLFFLLILVQGIPQFIIDPCQD